MNYDNIPTELRSLTQWGTYEKVWNEERHKYTKIPHNALNDEGGRSNAPDTWVDFQTALAGMKKFNRDGLAFYFGNGYVGLDIDHIKDEIEQYLLGDYQHTVVKDVIDKLQSYTEVSLSDEGIHAIFKGKIPGNRRRKSNIEMYESGRFFALTGKTIGPFANHVNSPIPENIKLLYTKFFGEDKVVQLPNQSTITTNDLDVDEIIRRAEMSKNGNRFKLFMQGGWENHYPSQSEADLAFADTLAFWCGRDFSKMDQIFRSSDLMRPKYDEQHGKTTYGNALLNKAINETSETFNPKKQPLNKYILNFGGDEDKKDDKPKPPRSWDDTGNADRFMDLYENIVRYSYIDKNWFVYNGSYWEVDNQGMIASYLDNMLEVMKNEKLFIAAGQEEENAKKNWDNFLQKTRSNHSKKAILDEIKHRVPILHGEFDKDKTLLNAENGYIDMNSGILHD
ncbi:phage NrS-1 polymerase family protein, partial [Paucilactobacillus sp. N302-9]